MPTKTVLLPSEVPIQETLSFLLPLMPPPGGRVLEVGCGEGALAQQLSARGVEVKAIDTSEQAVAAARRRGVKAERIDFLEFEAEPFSMIVFSRSLHHIHPLTEAVRRARSLLREGGVLAVEDFAWERADEITCAWFYELQGILAAAKVLPAANDQASASPLERWRRQHEETPPLHQGASIVQEIRKGVGVGKIEDAPYLYRYLVEKLPPDKDSYPIAVKVLEIERSLINEKLIRPVGMRIVART